MEVSLGVSGTPSDDWGGSHETMCLVIEALR